MGSPVAITVVTKVLFSGSMRLAVVPPPSLVPVESSAAFIDAYQERREFTAEELEIAWAASLWTAVHNARWEALHGDAPLSGEAVREQADERLGLANA